MSKLIFPEYKFYYEPGSIVEPDVQHGINCDCCTSPEIVQANERLREERIKQIHINNSKNTKRRAQRREQRLQVEESA